MTLSIREATVADRADWTAFVASRPEGDILQAWAWGEAGAGEPHERWSRLMVVDASGHVRGVAQVLARSTSLRRTILYVPHGPLWDREAPDAAAVLANLLSGLRSHARSRRGVVLKLDPRGTLEAESAALRRALLSSGLRGSTADLQAPTTRIVDLYEQDDPVAGWAKDARAEARRAEREGVMVEVDRVGDPAVLDDFHALLRETAERQGFRIRSRAFLEALARPLAETGDWFLSLARFDGTAIAGAIAPRTGERAFYLYAASSRDPTLVRKRGAYSAMAALQRAHREAGSRSLDLWGVREPDDDSVDAAWEGFSLFKRRFGGVPVRHPGTFDMIVDPFWHRLRELRERLRQRPR